MRREPTTRPARSVVLTMATAALVTAAALVAVVLVRPDHTREPEHGTTAAAGARPGQECGQGQCRVLDATTLDGTTVELLTDAGGGSAWLRVGGAGSTTLIELSITSLGAELGGDSLRCVPGAVPACLVRGPGDGGMVGEVVVARGGTWRSSERPYLSDAGTVALDDVSADDTAEVVVLRHDCDPARGVACDQTPVRAEVFGLAGEAVGCTRSYRYPAQLPGWPAVDLSSAELRACP